MNIYCTLFNSGYLSRGLACHHSLLAQTNDFLLYIFSFDDLTTKILKKLNLTNVVVITLSELETNDLIRVKSQRTATEYFWTCTPSTVLHVLDKYKHEHCTYIDADLFFYKDPNILIKEMGENAVLLTPHFYSPEYDQTDASGIFCVQFMTFKNNKDGIEVLKWWRDACIEWCFNKHEDGKFGDQKYLDDWPERFPKVYISQNKGEGVAPWNIQQWSENECQKIIFFHFHALSLFNDFSYFGGYKFPVWVKSTLYAKYIYKLHQIDKLLLSMDNNYKSCFKEISTWSRIKIYRDKFRLKNNFYHHEF